MALGEELNGTVRRSGIGEVAYVSGGNRDRPMIETYAGIVSDSGVGPTQPSGTATYSADYEYTLVTDVNAITNQLSWRHGVRSGRVTLVADFDAGTLRGNAGGFFRVDGTISGRGLDGSVTVPVFRASSLTGDLEGSIGQDGVVGAFQGNRGTEAFAGGLVGTRR